LLEDVDDQSAASARTADSATPAGSGAFVAIDLIRRNPDQPRQSFNEAELDALTDSIREKGVLQPILVRPAPGVDGAFQIVAGERRWRASQRAGLTEVPVTIRVLDDLEVLEIAVVENVQRADLNPIEEAQGYRSLIERFGRTQEAIAKAVGKSRSHVANALRLLSLPDSVREHLASDRLSVGHARAIAAAPDPSSLAERILAKGLNVRQAEALARQAAPDQPHAPRGNRPATPTKNADTAALEQDLEDLLGLTVSIHDREGKGELRVSYETLEQLDDICRRLSQPA
jgi:ParB family chromosome partitioning protein